MDDHSPNNVPTRLLVPSLDDRHDMRSRHRLFSRKRAVAMIAPMTMTDIPAVSTAVPTNSHYLSKSFHSR